VEENWGFFKLKNFPKCMGNHIASLTKPKKKVHLLNETIALRVRRHSTVMQVIGKLSRRSSLHNNNNSTRVTPWCRKINSWGSRNATCTRLFCNIIFISYLVAPGKLWNWLRYPSKDSTCSVWLISHVEMQMQAPRKWSCSTQSPIRFLSILLFVVSWQTSYRRYHIF
jgi:hypothetical protein